MTYEEWIKEQIDSLNDTQDDFRYGMLKAFELCLEKYGDAVPFDFDLYQAGLMDMPEEMIKVLDNIRAEIIEKDRNVKAVRSDNCCFFTVEEVLEIIDKYKEESEE